MLTNEKLTELRSKADNPGDLDPTTVLELLELLDEIGAARAWLRSRAERWKRRWYGFLPEPSYALAYDLAKEDSCTTAEMAARLSMAGVEPLRTTESWEEVVSKAAQRSLPVG